MERTAHLWTKATKGTLTSGEHDEFRALVAHEYVESRLMEAGMPYRSTDPGAWLDGALPFNPCILARMRWRPGRSGRISEAVAGVGSYPTQNADCAGDLSNLNEVVNAARKGLKL